MRDAGVNNIMTEIMSGEKGNFVVENKRYELVPPDGGWGYVICVSAIINFISIMMFVGCFGIIYKDLLIDLEMESTAVTLLNGTNMMCVAFSGLFINPLLLLMSKRQLGFLASFLLNVGLISVIFIKSKICFFICQGIQGIGIGVIYNITCTTINDYFLKKRFMAISLTSTVSAISVFIAPLVAKWFLDSYKFQGTIIMMFAVSMQAFVACALMQPVAKHLVRVELDPTTDEMELLLKEKNVPNAIITTPTITMTEAETFEAPIEMKTNTINTNGKNKTSKKTVIEFLDVPLLLQFLKSNASMAPAFCLFSDMLFGMMLPQALYAMNWSKELVAQAVSLAALGDLVTRVLFVLLSKWLARLGNQEIFLASVVLAFVSRLCMLWSESITAIMIYITLIGVSRCSINIMPPLILADIFSPDKFASALGMYMMILGLMNLILGPAIGAIRDSVNSYATAFYVLTACYAVIILLWSIELLYKRSKHKRIIQREAAEKLKKFNKGKN